MYHNKKGIELFAITSSIRYRQEPTHRQAQTIHTLRRKLIWYLFQCVEIGDFIEVE